MCIIMKLPQEFEKRMCRMLGDEYPAFRLSYSQESRQALRLNPKKAKRDFPGKAPFSLSPVPWAKDGYYYAKDDAPGKHPYHEAGVYYIQEPSAMAPVEYLDVQPGERILDLCAAPGGKSTQIAAKMQGKGILICNEIHPARAKILSENIERMGICNGIVTNETPECLLERFEAYFDKILVDAPCSGEGMFRKNEAACMEWSPEAVRQCAARQDAILSCAAKMLKPGGRLVYSTCTFAPEENEGSISRFLECFPDFEILPVQKTEGMTDGNPLWYADASDYIEDTIRLFPHKLGGEGHYLAVLLKRGIGQNEAFSIREEKGLSQKECGEYLKFAEENLKEMPEGIYLAFGDRLYLAPKGTPILKGLKVLRPGLHLGDNKKNRFEPSHALALFLNQNMIRRSIDFPSDSREILAYLEGQAISLEGEKGWHLITTDGYAIGWGKLSGGMMKNHYPKGLRKKLTVPAKTAQSKTCRQPE